MMSGSRLNSYPETFPDIEEVLDPSIGEQKDLTRRQKYVSSLLRKFWEQWSKEYLPSLQVNQKNKGGTIPPKVGDLVLIDNDTKRLNWPLGRITELIKGKDDQVRTVKIKSKLTTIERPVNKIYPLEVTSEIEDASEQTKSCEQTTPESVRRVRPQRDAAIRASKLIGDQLSCGGEDVGTSDTRKVPIE